MNKTIQKLADQCRTEYRDGHGGFTEQFDEERFAELIVKECAKFARQHNLEKADRSHMIHTAIREHFGVE